MNDFKFPNSITFNLVNLEDNWVKENPLFISIKTFAKNKVTEDKLWGGYDHYLDLLLLDQQKTTFSGSFLKEYDWIHHDLSAMEIRPIEYHYSLVEVELMTEASLNNWIKYLGNSKKFFAFDKVLGSPNYLRGLIDKSGNLKINYKSEFDRIRDIWDDEREDKVYELNFYLKMKV